MIEPHMPSRFAGSWNRYLNEGIPPGGFLLAVLENNLKESFARADHNSIRELPGIVGWLYTYAPLHTWGSPAKVEAHLHTIRMENKNANAETIGSAQE